jgi:hypothetical protein
MVYPTPDARMPCREALSGCTSVLGSLKIVHGLTGTINMLLDSSKKSLPGQIDLLRKFALLPPAFAPADGDTFTQLGFVFNAIPGAGTVVWKMDARERAGAEIVCTLCCQNMSASTLN